MTGLTYQVDLNRVVVSVKRDDGPAYPVTIRAVGKLPWDRKFATHGRWSGLKREVAHLPTGVHCRIGPFPDEVELVKASRTLMYSKDDAFLKSMLQGRVIKTYVDPVQLLLGVMVVEGG